MRVSEFARERIAMPDGVFPAARAIEVSKLNRYLACLPAKDFSLLAPHLRTVPLERGATLHDAGDEFEHLYFPHSGMVCRVAVTRSGATVETAIVGRAGILGFTAGFGSRRATARAAV